MLVLPVMRIDAQPTELELEVFTQVNAVLRCTSTILRELSLYRGASNEIRDVSVVLFTHFYVNLCAILSFKSTTFACIHGWHRH